MNSICVRHPRRAYVVVLVCTAMIATADQCSGGESAASGARVARTMGEHELGQIDWVRSGVVLNSTVDVQVRHAGDSIDGRSIDWTRRRRLYEFSWQPGDEYEFVLSGGAVARRRAPLAATPSLLHTTVLEDVGQAAAAGAAPDAVARFSPDGRRLAVGSFGGWLRIVDTETGKLLDRRRIAEGMVKQLRWSPDGTQLYVGEQSPDARLFAISVVADSTGRVKYAARWSVRLADQLLTSRPPAGDRYGIYTLPAVYDLHIVRDGRIVAAGVHSWTDNGRPRKCSVIYCFDTAGALQWRFPDQDAWQGTISHCAVDPEGTKVLFLPSPRVGPADNEEVPGNTLYQLDGQTGQVTARLEIEPLRPHFEHVESWDSVSLSPRADRAVLGLSDGRALLLRSDEDGLGILKPFPLGTPLPVGQLPIVAACSHARIFGDRAFLQTQNSHIPYSHPQAARHAPSIHPGANTMTVADLDGRVRWKYRGPYALGGAWSNVPHAASGTGDWLVVTCRALSVARQRGEFGFLLFDPRRSGGGRDRLVYHYPTDGPVTFAADISADGRWIAVVEVPAPTPDGEHLYGTHQLHVVH